jgi:hypothetical protein
LCYIGCSKVDVKERQGASVEQLLRYVLQFLNYLLFLELSI